MPFSGPVSNVTSIVADFLEASIFKDDRPGSLLMYSWMVLPDGSTLSISVAKENPAMPRFVIRWLFCSRKPRKFRGLASTQRLTG